MDRIAATCCAYDIPEALDSETTSLVTVVNDSVIVTAGNVRHSFRLSRPVQLKTIGFGLLERKILAGRSRYPLRSERLRREIEQQLVPSRSARSGFRDPHCKRLDTFEAAVIEAARSSDSSGVHLLHVMRRITTSTYNQDEFFGEERGNYKLIPLGERLERSGLRYHYAALPSCGPSARHLSRLGEGYGWESFKRDYESEITAECVTAAIVAVLEAAAQDSTALLVCCEPYVNCFDALCPEEKTGYGCHRFLLAKLIVAQLISAGVMVACQHLALNQFWTDVRDHDDASDSPGQ